METNVQPNVTVSARQESGNNCDVSVPVNVNLSPKLPQEPDTLNSQRQRSRKRARRDRSCESESRDACQLQTGAEQDSLVAESSHKSLNKTGLDQLRQSSEVDMLYEPDGARQEQPPKYDNLSNNEQEDDTLEFYTPMDTPLPIVHEDMDMDAPLPDTDAPVYHQDDTLKGVLSRSNASTSAAAATADVAQIKKSTKLDLELPSSGRPLGAVVSEFVSSLRDDEYRQKVSECIAQAEKSTYFPGKMNALIDAILSPDDTAYLLSLSMWLPAATPELDAMLSANLRGWDRKAAMQWLPTTIEYPTGYENWELESWDMWHYVHYAMGYFSRYLFKFTAEKNEHSEGWLDANVWTYIFDHAYQSSEILNLERNEVQSIIDKPILLDADNTTPDMIAAAAMGKRLARPGHPAGLIPMPKYDGIVSYTPNELPSVPRFDLCFFFGSQLGRSEGPAC